MNRALLEMETDSTLCRTADDLRRITAHCARILAEASVETTGQKPGRPCRNPDCACRQLLRSTLLDTISVLDDTRRNFKSKQLAALRHKLTEVLANHT
ncbi:MAG TPA: hypothetical protein PKO36_17585 [Candidatus Hydrogenedentes bacterium]|nr:hypothetical protein [Candidatus Hydrogenedentota bacterium]HOV76094.1 hypothetical protein [Candidatus Hydrogenedentota bacterium]HPC17381.1 hypothetical protein [Candidatus Hydrogenedentota bacterium]HRT20115.1 hypothetical protein [Candidatus Hydrogenedentota bacterium]HRT64821.1 hypothetical protein [Candidatus Hydrogenedentota bacterium]